MHLLHAAALSPRDLWADQLSVIRACVNGRDRYTKRQANVADCSLSTRASVLRLRESACVIPRRGSGTAAAAAAAAAAATAVAVVIKTEGQQSYCTRFTLSILQQCVLATYLCVYAVSSQQHSATAAAVKDERGALSVRVYVATAESSEQQQWGRVLCVVLHARVRIKQPAATSVGSILQQLTAFKARCATAHTAVTLTVATLQHTSSVALA
eukprot:2244-Heterococcus_DN1.PRE.1